MKTQHIGHKNCIEKEHHHPDTTREKHESIATNHILLLAQPAARAQEHRSVANPT